MSVKTQPNYLGDGIAWEQEDLFSRELVTVLSGQNLALLAVIGMVLSSCPTTGTADAGNTGNGTCTAVTAGQDVQIGTYTLECITAVGDGGIFKVVAPDGSALPDATVGTAYANSQLNFTLNDGATDFIVGDIFTIAVAAGSGKVVELDPDAVDGSQKAYGIMALAVDASSADKTGPAIVRDAMAVTANLVWPTGITAGEKTKALAELKAAGIVATTSV